MSIEFPIKREFWVDSNGSPFENESDARSSQAEIDLSIQLYGSNVDHLDLIDFIKKSDYKVVEKICENIMIVKDGWEKI